MARHERVLPLDDHAQPSPDCAKTELRARPVRVRVFDIGDVRRTERDCMDRESVTAAYHAIVARRANHPRDGRNGVPPHGATRSRRN